LKLTEHATFPEKRERDPDDRGRRAFARLRCVLRNASYDLHGALVEKIAHLFRDLVPRTCWILS
jgi:hypothetical protein